MSRQFYSRRHYERLSNGGPDSHDVIRDRNIHREACRRLEIERGQMWPSPTVEHARDMIAWQEQRLPEIEAEVRAGVVR